MCHETLSRVQSTFKREIEQMSWEDLLPAVKEDLQVEAMISLFIYDKNILIWKIRPLVGHHMIHDTILRYHLILKTD